MRISALAILTIGTTLTAAPAPAQTYDPAYPICLQAFGEKADYIECGYTSLPQCAVSASGRKGPRGRTIDGTAASTKCLATARPRSSPDSNV